MGNSHNKIKVAVGLSGGVDSSVAAALLVEQGYDVFGLTMEIYDGSVLIEEGIKHACYGPGEEDDVAMASSVCKSLKIPYHTVDLKAEYRSHVLDYFRSEYLLGRTPNPCVRCNQELKFGFMLDRAREAGLVFDYFATGHYARIDEVDGHFYLKKAVDLSKDQTYFIHGLSPEQLSRCLFPLGDFKKPEVRKIAASLDLETAHRIESQDFVSGGDYSILFNDSDQKPGDIVDQKGELLGKHEGIIHYTIGQRRGLGIASSQPLYVIKIDAAKNQIVVSEKSDIFADGLIATDCQMNPGLKPKFPFQAMVKIRLTHTETEAQIDKLENGRLKMMFDTPQMSVTPGQSVVLYHDDRVVGGGIIEKPI